MIKNLITIIFISFVSNANAQDLSIFDLQLNKENISLIDLIDKFELNNKPFSYYPYKFDDGKSFYCVTDTILSRNKLFLRRIVLRAEKINQLSYNSKQKATVDNFNETYNYSNELLDSLSKKYGKPVGEKLDKTKFIHSNKKVISGNVATYIWNLDQSKLKLEVSVEFEYNNNYFIYFTLIKYEDYIGNMEVLSSKK